jgi:hypothetical protein
VGVTVAQPCASVLPVPVQVPAVQPLWPLFTHAPVGHWLSLVHWHCMVPVLQTPAAGAGQEGVPGGV